MSRDNDAERGQWIERLRDGSSVLIRPIRSEDAQLERDFIGEMSAESRYYRFMQNFSTPSDEMIEKLTNIDHARDAAFIALIQENGKPKMIGVSRYYLEQDDNTAECAVVVSDDHRNIGLGNLLMRHLIEHARARGVGQLFSIDAANNRSMTDFFERIGFDREIDSRDATLVQHTLNLHPLGRHPRGPRHTPLHPRR